MKLGDPATDIHGTDAAGASIRLSQFKGNVILLDIAKMGCTVCEVSVTPLQVLYEAYGSKGLSVVICLAEDDRGGPVTKAELERWVSSHQPVFPVINDATGSKDGVAEQVYTNAMGGFPTMVIIDKEFKIHYLERGLDITALSETIKSLLNAQDPGLTQQ